MTDYPNVTDDWFVRENVRKELDTKIPLISSFLMSNDIDYEEDIGGIVDALNEHFENVEDLTHDELEWMLTSIQVFTALEELKEDGIIEQGEDGRYRAIECEQ